MNCQDAKRALVIEIEIAQEQNAGSEHSERKTRVLKYQFTLVHTLLFVVLCAFVTSFASTWWECRRLRHLLENGRSQMLTKAAIPFVVEQLRSCAVERRRMAAETIRYCGPLDSAATDALIQATSDRDQDVRVEAIVSLGQAGLGNANTVQALLQILDDPEPIGLLAAVALGKVIRDSDPLLIERLRTRLITALRDDDPQVRMSAINSLGSIGFVDESIIRQLLVTARNYGDWWEYLAAVWALRRMGAPAAPHLLEAMRNPEDRNAAEVVLNCLGPDSSDAVPHLVAALRDENSDVRNAAATVLDHIMSAQRNLGLKEQTTSR